MTQQCVKPVKVFSYFHAGDYSLQDRSDHNTDHMPINLVPSFQSAVNPLKILLISTNVTLALLSPLLDLVVLFWMLNLIRHSAS